MRRLFRRPAWFAVPGAMAATAAIASATTVLACTAVMGPLTITPTSGAAGTQITTSATGVKAGATYAMHFTKTSSGDCMSFAGVITMKKVTADGSGTWTGVKMTIPSTAKMGTHGVCGIETAPVKGATGTTHDTFTVT